MFIETHFKIEVDTKKEFGKEASHCEFWNDGGCDIF